MTLFSLLTFMKVSPGETFGQNAETLARPFLQRFALCVYSYGQVGSVSEELCQVLTLLACSLRSVIYS